jgi:glc operon protein GlcG
MKTIIVGLALAASVLAAPTFAQTPASTVPETMPFDIPYGEPIGLDQAKQVADAAMGEMKKHNWKMAIAIVDPSGGLVFFEKIDGTQNASVRIAQDKAKSAVGYRRPTKAFGDAIAGGSVAVMSLHGVVGSEGGIPLVQGGKMIGAIGVSGGLSSQDGVVAKAGADTVK